jgi:hypothetical protein
MSQNYKVYSISPKTPTHPTHIYFGSTSLDVNTRYILHRSSFKNSRDYTSSHFLFKTYGINECECVELDSGLTKEEARIKESQYIQSIPCINKYRNYITDLKQYHKDYQREYRPAYYEANRERLLELNRRKFECSCGAVVRRYYAETHIKSQKHKKLSALCIDCNARGRIVSLQGVECGL